MSKLLSEPPSLRVAAGTIVIATGSVVLVGGIAMHLIDGHQYPDVWIGMWWAIQTVTTVGYGDVTPTATSGRLFAAAVMLEGIAFLAVTTAVITSTFVARAAAERGAAEAAAEKERLARLEAKLDRLDERLGRIEQALGVDGRA
jgi:voltage-gated potassium channel